MTDENQSEETGTYENPIQDPNSLDATIRGLLAKKTLTPDNLNRLQQIFSDPNFPKTPKKEEYILEYLLLGLISQKEANDPNTITYRLEEEVKKNAFTLMKQNKIGFAEMSPVVYNKMFKDVQRAQFFLNALAREDKKEIQSKWAVSEARELSEAIDALKDSTVKNKAQRSLRENVLKVVESIPLNPMKASASDKQKLSSLKNLTEQVTMLLKQEVPEPKLEETILTHCDALAKKSSRIYGTLVKQLRQDIIAWELSTIDKALTNLENTPQEPPLKEFSKQFIAEVSKLRKNSKFQNNAADVRNVRLLIQSVSDLMFKNNADTDIMSIIRALPKYPGLGTVAKNLLDLRQTMTQNFNARLGNALDNEVLSKLPLNEQVIYWELYNILGFYGGHRGARPQGHEPSQEDIFIDTLVLPFLFQECQSFQQKVNKDNSKKLLSTKLDTMLEQIQKWPETTEPTNPPQAIRKEMYNILKKDTSGNTQEILYNLNLLLTNFYSNPSNEQTKQELLNFCEAHFTKNPSHIKLYGALDGEIRHSIKQLELSTIDDLLEQFKKIPLQGGALSGFAEQFTNEIDNLKSSAEPKEIIELIKAVNGVLNETSQKILDESALNANWKSFCSIRRKLVKQYDTNLNTLSQDLGIQVRRIYREYLDNITFSQLTERTKALPSFHEAIVQLERLSLTQKDLYCLKRLVNSMVKICTATTEEGKQKAKEEARTLHKELFEYKPKSSWLPFHKPADPMAKLRPLIAEVKAAASDDASSPRPLR